MRTVRYAFLLAVLAAGFFVAAYLATGSSSSAPVPESRRAVASRTSPDHFRFFSPRSVWNEPVSGEEAIDPASAAIVTALCETVEREDANRKGPWINTTEYSVPIVRVRRDQPLVEVKLAARYRAPALRAAFSAVPLPSGAQPSAGHDGHLLLWQPGTDRLWEFWHLEHTPAGWRTGWGGAIEDVEKNNGAYNGKAWPGATSLWGASASSLSIAGGLITLEDLRSGVINHALTMSVPNVRKGVYALPARRTDGWSTNPLSLPEGAHLRISPAVDLDTLGLRPVTLMMARAAQRYGIVIRDGAQNVTFNAQAPRSPARNPYPGPGGYFEGLSPRELLAGFPWQSLELLQMRLHPFGSRDPAH